MPKLPYAHDVDYWKTGTKRTPAQWIDLAVAQIRDHGGTSIVQASGEQEGHEAYMIGFTLSDDQYKIIWPVLPIRWEGEKDRVAARRQAATTLYHDVKARCVSAARYGNRQGFFQYRMLPNGQSVAELADGELTAALPALMRGGRPQLESQ